MADSSGSLAEDAVPPVAPRRLLDRLGLRLSPSPDLGGTLPMICMILVVSVAICAFLIWKANNLDASLGDTDDAMRLVLVRDLANGQGWYDQLVARLDPPHGVWLHWSRLLDGGLAGTMSVLRQFASPARAEWLTRFFWPLAWVFPAIAAAFVIARNVGGRSAVLLTAPLLIMDPMFYRQFIPGRIDHHNIQITMTVIALACALARRDRARWALVGGVAAGLGMAIGLEALPLQALIGASYGLALARDRGEAKATAAYGLAMAAASVGFFAIQTPPWRWGLPFCDALAINLVAALAMAGVGLAATAAVAARAPAWGRLAMLAVTGALAAGLYLGLDPQCIHGPFAAMDPAVKPFWFDRIQEVQPLPHMLARARSVALVVVVLMAMVFVSGAYLLAREWRAPRTPTLLIVACLTEALITGYFTWRMQDYVFWIGIPAMGAALSLFAARWLRDLMVPSFALTLILSPEIVGAAVDTAISKTTPASHGARLVDAGPRCFAPAAYRALAKLPPGLVLAPQDLGPFILATTGQSVVAAPYHRMSAQILAVHRVFDAPPAQAEARVRALGATYVLDCPPYPLVADPGSFGARLRAGPAPAWLEALSGAGDSLKVYRVRPPA